MKTLKLLLIVLVLTTTVYNCTSRYDKPAEPIDQSETSIGLRNIDTLLLTSAPEEDWKEFIVDSTTSILAQKVETIDYDYYDSADQMIHELQLEIPLQKTFDYKYYYIKDDILDFRVFTFHSVHIDFQHVQEYLEAEYKKLNIKPFQY